MTIESEKTYLLEFVADSIKIAVGGATLYFSEDETVGRLYKDVVLVLTKKEYEILMMILDVYLREFIVIVTGNDTQTFIEGPLSHVDRLVSKLREYID